MSRDGGGVKGGIDGRAGRRRLGVRVSLLALLAAVTVAASAPAPPVAKPDADAPVAAKPAAGDGGSDQPRATMDRVFEALRVLLPLSLDAKRFASPENQPAIAKEIEALAGAANALESHGANRDRGFRFLSGSLASDVEEIRQRYRFGRLEEARFFVLESTRNCVACHSRLPSAQDFPLGSKLLDRVDMKSLSSHERSQLYVATRQFDKALASWESLFADPGIVSAAQLDVGGYLNDYLAIAIRVKGDYGRARRALEVVRARKDVPDYLKPQLDAWVRDLAGFEHAPPDWKDLGTARKLADRKPSGDVEGDALSATITDLVASSLLLRFIDHLGGAPGHDAQLAEAYYLLGKVEARSADSFWVPQAPFHLEIAIRLDPKGPHAEEALRLYEEQMAFGYGGIESDVLPVDLWTNLDELRKLVETGGP